MVKILILITLLTVWISPVRADLDSYIDKDKKIIWCINTYTNKTTATNNNWNCFNWPNWQNIMLPNKEQYKIWKEVFWSDRAIINRLSIVNFESWFNENASNKWAIWYVQTLRVYNISTDIKEQLIWMKNRQESQKKYTAWWRLSCGYYWTHYNYKDWFNAWEDWVMACLYRYHYNANTWMWYSKKLMKTREYYLDYFNTN